MRQIEDGILYEDRYLGVTLGALICPRGSVLIDAPLRAEDSRSWRSALLNFRGGPNRLMAIIDAHPDRTLGTRSLESTILAHDTTAQVFRDRPTIFKGQGADSGAVWEMYDEAIGMRWVVPDITFNQRMTLHWGGPELVFEYHPGPTTGSIWVIIPGSKVVFVGDMVVIDQPPFLADADLDAWLEGLDLLLTSYSDYVIVSGRGGPATIKVVRAQLRYLERVIKDMDKLASEGASAEATEGLISSLLSRLSIEPGWRDLYRQRLQNGLYQCYVRRYQSPRLQGEGASNGIGS